MDNKTSNNKPSGSKIEVFQEGTITRLTSAPIPPPPPAQPKTK